MQIFSENFLGAPVSFTSLVECIDNLLDVPVSAIDVDILQKDMQIF